MLLRGIAGGIYDNTTLKRVDFHVMQVYIRWKSIYTISDTAEKTVQDFGINFMQ